MRKVVTILVFVASGLTRAAVSRENGGYSVLFLPVGPYELTASPNTITFSGNSYSSSAGVITSTSTTSRQIQFALKLLF